MSAVKCYVRKVCFFVFRGQLIEIPITTDGTTLADFGAMMGNSVSFPVYSRPNKGDYKGNFLDFSTILANSFLEAARK